MDDDTKAAIEAVSASVAAKSVWVTSAMAAYSFIASAQFLAFVSVILGVIGFGANIYFKMRADKREQQEWEKRMKKLDTKPIPLEDI